MKKELTIGLVAKEWGCDPREWGMCGRDSVIFDESTPCKFQRIGWNTYILDVMYPCGTWSSTGLTVEAKDVVA